MTTVLDPMLRPDRRGAFRLLFFCLLAVGAGNTMLTSAVLPPLTRQLGLPDWTAGAIFSLSAAVWVVFSPYWGAKSNRWGRRLVTAIGMFGFAASMLLFALFAMAGLSGWITGWGLIFALLLGARSLFGVFGSGANPAAQAYVADRTSREERADEIASLTSGFTFGQMVGPAVAAALMSVFGILSPVFAITIIAAGVAVYVLLKLPEHRAPMLDASRHRSGARGLWRRRDILPFLVYAVGLSLVTGVLQQTFPYAIMDRMHVQGTASAEFTAPAMTIGAAATLISQLVLIPRLKLPIRSLMVYGAIMLALASVLMIWAQQFALFAFSQLLFGLGQGFSRPGFSAGASLAAGPEQQGDVAGLVTAANGMGFVVSPLFGLWMYENVSRASPFILCAVVLAAMIAYAWLTVRADDPNAVQAQPALNERSGADTLQ